MIGDIVGEPGLRALEARLPRLIAENSINCTVVNGENAAEGFGMTEAELRRILAAGADVITSGNHIWEKRDFWPVLETEEKLLRPANYPALNGKTPGHGWVRLNITMPALGGMAAAGENASDGVCEANSNTKKSQGRDFLVINLQGREFMTPIDCPFRSFDSIYDAETADAKHPVVIVDFHAESTREKETLAYYLDGRASVVAGTHTHVQTADERILPAGTAYITDLGMTGISDSV
ncbi:MAG: YmdB family metallophosphoesterase, partial [Treponema sp.]|nr:YmdB family metallophosphoesterase [Treponema sp.]